MLGVAPTCGTKRPIRPRRGTEMRCAFLLAVAGALRCCPSLAAHPPTTVHISNLFLPGAYFAKTSLNVRVIQVFINAMRH